MRPTEDHAKQGGFSMVELMIGAVLIVVGLLGIMSACIRLHALQRLDTEIGQAYRSCRSNLEELRAVTLADLEALDGTGFDVVGPDGVTTGLQAVAGDADGLPGRIEVTVDQSAAGRVVYRIRAVVTWSGATEEHTVDLQTLRDLLVVRVDGLLEVGIVQRVGKGGADVHESVKFCLGLLDHGIGLLVGLREGK